MALKDTWDKIGKDLMDELKEPSHQEDFQRIKRGVSEAAGGIASLGEVIFRKHDDTPSATVIVEEEPIVTEPPTQARTDSPTPPIAEDPLSSDCSGFPGAASSSETTADSNTTDTPSVRVQFHGLWNTQFGSEPQVLPDRQLQFAMALCKVELYRADNSLFAVFENEGCAHASHGNLLALRDQIGALAWSCWGAENPDAVGAILQQCSVEVIVTHAQLRHVEELPDSSTVWSTNMID